MNGIIGTMEEVMLDSRIGGIDIIKVIDKSKTGTEPIETGKKDVTMTKA